MAIRSHRRLFRSLFNRQSVHALLVRDERLAALPVRFHQELLPVAPATGGGNIVMMHRRLGVVGGHDLVNATMAILAGCRRRSVAAGLGVEAVRVSLRSLRMA